METGVAVVLVRRTHSPLMFFASSSSASHFSLSEKSAVGAGPAPHPRGFHRFLPRAAASWASLLYGPFEAHSLPFGKGRPQPSEIMIAPTSTHLPPFWTAIERRART